ncbi:hypothetical protein BHM03_00000126 [Ensete ventricosum]|nr:hypothetical protein BHM03_00000126 [Ensete ventricosum]
MANSRASCVRHVISEGCVVCCCAWLRVYAVLLHLLGVSSLVRLVYSLGGIIACTDLGSRNIPCESCCVPFISVAARFGEGLLSFLLPSRFSARIFGPSVIVSRASTSVVLLRTTRVGKPDSFSLVSGKVGSLVSSAQLGVLRSSGAFFLVPWSVVLAPGQLRPDHVDRTRASSTRKESKSRSKNVAGAEREEGFGREVALPRDRSERGRRERWAGEVGDRFLESRLQNCNILRIGVAITVRFDRL